MTRLLGYATDEELRSRARLYDHDAWADGTPYNAELRLLDPSSCVTESNGWREHESDETCWCRPELDGDVVFHTQPIGSFDDVGRMAKFSRQ